MKSAKSFLRRLISVDIVKVFTLNAVSTLIRMLAGMISVKIVAVIIGPAGIALLGQLNNFNGILQGVSNGGINTGITKYVAEYREDDNYIRKLLSNALRITLFCSLLIGIVSILGSYSLSRMILMSDEYFYVFIIFGITITLYSLNGFLISVLNGFKSYRKYVLVNIAGTIVGLVFSVILVVCFGLPGALINAVTYQSIVFFVTLWICRKEVWLKWDNFREKLEKPIVKKYLKFSAMTLTTLALLPVSQLILRGYVISRISATDAGIWEGMNRISGMYLNVITSAFMVYYLPRLSEIKDNIGLHHEIFRCYKFLIPMLLCIGITIFVLRHFILWLLFTPEFYPMENLFVWQLLGDFFKICSWLLSFQMVAKAKSMLYISTEILYTAVYIVASFLLLHINGIVGLTQGYLVSYCIYFVSMLILFRSVIFVKTKGL